MANQFLNHQNQLSTQIFDKYIEFRSLGFSTIFNEQNLNIKLRGGGCALSIYTSQQQIHEPEPQQNHPVPSEEITLDEIINLILLRGPKASPQEQQQINQKVVKICQKIPNVIENYENIQNEMLSFLIFEQLGQKYQSEFDKINFIGSEHFSLEGLKYQSKIITAQQQKQKINNDKNMRELKELNNQDNSIQPLIDNIKNIEMQLIVSQQINCKDYSSLMIYKLNYCFEKLFQFFYSLNKDVEKKLEEIYTEVILNSKSIHIYNQWITFISNLYLIRPVENSNQNNNLRGQQQIFRVLNNQVGIILFQNNKNNNNNNIQQVLEKKYNIAQRFQIIQSIKDIKYLRLDIKEITYVENQININKKLINNFINYGQSEKINQLLEHIESEQQHSNDPEIVKLKNVYINIIIDCVQILISFNAFQNQCKLVNDLNKTLQEFQNLLGERWKNWIRRITEKVFEKSPQQVVNLAEELKKIQQVKFDQHIEGDFQNQNTNCLVDTLNYYRVLMQTFINVIDYAIESQKQSGNTSESKVQNYLLIIFTMELIGKLNNYYLTTLKIIFLQILNYPFQIKGIQETIELFIKIIRQYTQIKKLFSNKQYISNQLFQKETQESQDINKLKNASSNEGDKIVNTQQKQILQKLKELYNNDQQIQIRLPQDLKLQDLQDYNKFIVLLLQQLQYPQEFKLSKNNSMQNENLVLQLIKILILCSEVHIFEFALEMLIDIWLENICHKLMLNDKILQLMQNCKDCLKVNMEYFKTKIFLFKLDNINKKIVDQGIQQFKELYVQNKIKSELFQENDQQLSEQLNNNFVKKINQFLGQFWILKFNYLDSLTCRQQSLNNNNLSFEELIQLRQKIVIEQKYQNIKNGKYNIDLKCKNLESQGNTQTENLNEIIKKFIDEDKSKILIIYGQNGPGRISVFNQTQQFVWEQYNSTKIWIPITVFVNIDNLTETKIQTIIVSQLSQKIYKQFMEKTLNNNKNNTYSIIFLIMIQEDQDFQQIIEAVKQMNLLITIESFTNSKIICFMKSEIRQCNEYLKLIKQNDQLLLVQLKIKKTAIEQVLQAKLKNCIKKYLRKQDILIYSDKFESIWNSLKFIINNKEIKNDELLDDVQVKLLIEFLDYHFTINNKKELKSEIKNLKSPQYYMDKIYGLYLNNKISKTFLLVMILEFLPSMDVTKNRKDYLIKNFTFIFYQEALIKKQNDKAANLENIDIYIKQAQNHFDDLNKKYQLGDTLKQKFSLYEIYIQFIQTKYSQNKIKEQNKVDQFYLEKAFENAELQQITIDNSNKEHLEISIIEYNIDNGYQFIDSSFQDFYISKFILDFLNIEIPEISTKNGLEDWLKNNPKTNFTQNLNIFNKNNFSKQTYNGIFKFLSDEVRIRFLDAKILKFIKMLIDQQEQYIQALSNAFYLYSKIFGIIKEDNFENINLKDISLEGCTFYKVNFNNSVFLNVNITNCNFVYCTLENVKWENLRITNFSQKEKIFPKYIILSKTSDWVIYYEESDKGNQVIKKEIKGSKQTFKKIELQVFSIAISNDDQILAIGSNQEIQLLNTQNLKEKRSIKQPTKEDILQITFIQNDEQIIYSNSNKEVVLLNIKEKIEQFHSFKTDALVNVMVFSSSQEFLAFSSGNIINLYNLKKKINPNQFVQLQQQVLTLAFQSNFNNILISCCQNGYVQFWDIQSKKNIKVIELYNTTPLLLSPKGKFIVYKDHQNYIKLYDLEYSEVIYSFNGSQVQQNQIQFSKDGGKLGLGLQVWDISGIQNKADDNIRCIEISPDGVYYAIGYKSHISICDSKGGMAIDKLKGHTGFVNAIAYSSDALQLVSVGDDKQVIYWDLFYCQIINQHIYHQNRILSVAISNDKQFIASGDINGNIFLQKIEPWEMISNITASEGQINSLSFGFDQQNKSLYLASGNADKQIKLWKIITQSEQFQQAQQTQLTNQIQQAKQMQQAFQEYHTFNGHTDEIRCVTFSRDGSKLASCSNDKSIRFWNVHQQQYLFSLNGHRDHVICIRFTRNNQIWSCSKDNTIRLWDIEQKIMIINLDSNNSNLKSFALNLDDKYLLLLSENQSIKLWDLNGFYYKEEQIKQQKTIKAIALSSDGQTIAYLNDNNLISLLDVNTKQPINHLQLEGIADQIQFYRQNYLICVVKINNLDKIFKWKIENNELEYLGEGSKIAISFDSQYLAYAKSKILNFFPDKFQQETHEIKILCYSSKDILATISDQEIFIWNYKKKTKKNTITFKGAIKFCSFTKNGEWFAFSSGDSIISFCSTEKFGKQEELQQSKNYENKSKNIKNILICNLYLIVLFDDEIKVLNPNLKEIQAQSYQQNQILNIAISQNGKNLVVLKKNFSIEFIKIEDFKEYDSQYKTNLVCFYSNGEKLLTGYGKIIEIIDQQNSTRKQSQTLNFDIKQIILSKNNSKIAVAGEKQIIIYDQNLEKRLYVSPEQNYSIQSITFSSGESFLAYVCQDQLKFWDFKKSQEDTSKFNNINIKTQCLIQFFNQIFNLLIVTNDKLIVFDVETKKEKQSSEYKEFKILIIAISKDDKIIAAGCEDGKIRLWNTSDLKQFDIDYTCKGIICLDFHPNSDQLVTIGIDNIIKIFSIKDKCKNNELQINNNSTITQIKYHPKKNELFFCGNDGKLYFCQIDWPNLTTLFEIQYFIDEILNYSISSNGKKLAIQNISDRYISIIEVETGKSFEQKVSTQSYLKLSDDGNTLAYCSWKDLRLEVCDLQTGNAKAYENHKNKINTIDFSKDKKKFIVGYSDGAIQLFESEKKNPTQLSSDNYSKIMQITFCNSQIAQLNSDSKLYLKQEIHPFQIRKSSQSKNAIGFKVYKDNTFIVKKAGSQFEIVDKDLKSSQPAKHEQINESLINIENQQQFWKYRIGYIELNPFCRTFPIIISKINQQSQFTLEKNIKINEYFDRQFI